MKSVSAENATEFGFASVQQLKAGEETSDWLMTNHFRFRQLRVAENQ
jgi:hypothetical protein